MAEENQFQLLKMIKEARDMDYLSISGSLAKELIQLTMIRYLSLSKNVDGYFRHQFTKTCRIIKV